MIEILLEGTDTATMVSTSPIQVGSQVDWGRLNYTVTEILEKRKEKGIYKDEKNRRDLYKVKVNVKLI